MGMWDICFVYVYSEYERFVHIYKQDKQGNCSNLR